MKKKEQREGFIILSLVISGICFYNTLGNGDNMIVRILMCLFAGVIGTFILFIFVQIMKNWFKW